MTQTDNGDCYEAAAIALFMPEYAGGIGLPEEAVLVHGRPTLTRAPFTEYGHAWIELGDAVFEVANGRKTVVRREVYYDEGNIDPEQCLRYTTEEAKQWALHAKHFGPWEGPEAIRGEPRMIDREYDAWRQVCLHLEQHLPGNQTINDDCDNLVAALKLWGEELAGLRATQNEKMVLQVLKDARTGMEGNWLEENNEESEESEP